MSEQDNAAPPAKPQPIEKKPIENPQLAYVRGGTGTSKSEKLYEQRYQEAEVRRDIADKEREASKDQKEIDGPGGKMNMPGHVGGAVQYTSQMTAHPEIPKAFVCLTYLTPGGDVAYMNGEPVRCKADIIVGADPTRSPNELCLILVCPRCEQDSHKHHQDNQLRIFQSNKNFELVPGKGDPFFRWKDDDGVVRNYRSAGMITESERFTCGDCGWRARIDANRVRPD